MVMGGLPFARHESAHGEGVDHAVIQRLPAEHLHGGDVALLADGPRFDAGSTGCDLEKALSATSMQSPSSAAALR